MFRWRQDEDARGSADPRLVALRAILVVGLWVGLLTAVLTLTPYQVLGALLALFGGLALLFRPKEALLACLGLRVLVDMLWWVKSTGLGLNVMELFGAAVTLGVAILVLLRFPVVEKHPAFPWFLVYALLMGVAVLRAPGVQELEYFFKFVGQILFLLMVSVLLTDRRWEKFLLGTFVAAGVLPVLYSLYSLATHTNYEFAAGAERLVGGYVNGTNHALTMTFLAGLGLMWTLYLGRSWLGLGAGLFTLGAATALYHSNFRSAHLAFALIVVLMLAVHKRWRLLALALVGGTVLYLQSDIMQERFTQLYNEAFTEEALEDPTRRMGSGRLELWTTSMRYFLGRPAYDWLIGMGMGMHRAYRMGVDPHNDYLSILYQAGPLTVLAYLVIVFQSVRRAWAVAVSRPDRWTLNVACLVVAFGVAGAFTNFITNGYVSRASPAWYYMSILGIGFALDPSWRKGSMGDPRRLEPTASEGQQSAPALHGAPRQA